MLAKILQIVQHFDSGWVQKGANLVDLKNKLQKEFFKLLLAKSDFGTAENEPSKVPLSNFGLLRNSKSCYN